ncbi:MAG TPA: SsrA-binding protein SmpB [Acidimicrobiales bacterium]|nr:SsrA-binding protein SmpB [Acidimicrobiales bacterium]
MPAPKKLAVRAPTISNRRARHDYEIIEVFEAGIQLVGSEVKSIREGHVQLGDCYGRVMDGEVWLVGMHINPYANAHGFGAHDPDRHRKLLLHKREIGAISQAVNEKQLSLVPLRMWFKDGKVKVDLAIARGKKTYDKRHAIAKRDAERDEDRARGRRR